MPGRDSLVGSATVRVVPNCYVACGNPSLLRGVQRRVGVEAVGVIERGGRMVVVEVVVDQVGIGLVVERCGSDG